MRGLIGAALVAIATSVPATDSVAQVYPSRGLRFIVPFAPGGSTDIVARLIGNRLASALGQPVVVENRAGAAGNIGAEIVAKSAPDGYTLLMATTGVMSINNSIYRSMAFDAAKDLEAVIFVTSITNALIVSADSELKTVGDLLAAAKAAPGKLTFASSGSGASTHMSGELFKMMAGIDLTHIPYKGSALALPDIMVGRVTMMFDNMPGAVPHINAGKVRVLAVTGLKRSAAMPQVPTVAESGVPGYESLSWSGIAVAAGTPKDVIARLNSEFNAILAAPDLRQKLAEQGADVVGGTPEAFADHIRSERDKWSRVVREARISIQ